MMTKIQFRSFRISALAVWVGISFGSILHARAQVALLETRAAQETPGGTGGNPGYHVVRRIPIGGEGGWDYLAVDPDRHRLFIPRSTHVMVMDEETGKVVGDISDTKDVHGIALAPDLGKGFTSNGGANTVTIFDLKTLTLLSTVKVSGDDPDSIIYDPVTKRVFTMNGRTSNATAIDAVSGKVVGTVALAGKPETPVLDNKGSIFVNIQDKNQEVQFDTKTLDVRQTYPLPGCKAPSGNAFDAAHGISFIGCSENKRMAIFSTATGKLIANPEICADTDASGFDPGTGLAFASCRDGNLSIIRQDPLNKFSLVGNVRTQAGARTMVVDPKTHHIFVVTATFKSGGTPTATNPRPESQLVPGSFVVLELAPNK